MTNIRLRPGIAHRGFRDCAIILDVDRDRYWQVSGHVARLLDRLAQGEAGALTPADRACLDNLGLVESTGGDVPSPSGISLPAPAASALEVEVPTGRFGLAEAIEVAWLAVAARRRIRRRSLRSVLAAVDGWRDDERRDAQADVAALARRFARYRRLVPIAPLCLPDTIAFLRFAARRGCFPRLVFGVEAWPFAAHCWAQADDIVLTDALHHVRSFSPILVL
ncbi:MAG: lasso peptide biosynthesis B2 protein [Agrococcus sp.]